MGQTQEKLRQGLLLACRLCVWLLPVQHGRTVGKDWPNNGCNVNKGGNCDELCASNEVKKDNWGKELIIK